MDVAFLDFLASWTKCDIFKNRHVWEQGVLLEHRIDISLVRGNRRYINTIEYDTTRSWLLKASDHFQRRCFAATGWTEHGKEFTASYREIDVINGNEIAVPFAEMIQLNDVHRHPRDSPRGSHRGY